MAMCPEQCLMAGLRPLLYCSHTYNVYSVSSRKFHLWARVNRALGLAWGPRGCPMGYVYLLSALSLCQEVIHRLLDLHACSCSPLLQWGGGL